jgi:hypothetical protein
MDLRANLRISLIDKVQSNIFSDDVKDILRHPKYCVRFDCKEKIREILSREDTIFSYKCHIYREQ